MKNFRRFLWGIVLFLINRYDIRGRGNVIFVNGRRRRARIRGLRVKIRGNGNRIYIKDGRNISDGAIKIEADGAEMHFGAGGGLKFDISVGPGDNQYFSVGDDVWVSGALRVFMGERAARIEIGRDCIVAANAAIWGTDFHAVIDRGSGRPTNRVAGRPTIIGDHCWLGSGVSVLKGARIPDNTIVGLGAVVVGRFADGFTAIAGNPARVVKTDVEWRHENPDKIL